MTKWSDAEPQRDWPGPVHSVGGVEIEYLNRTELLNLIRSLGTELEQKVIVEQLLRRRLWNYENPALHGVKR